MVVWCALALVLTTAAAKFGVSEFRYHSAFLALFSVIRALTINLAETSAIHGFTLRLITIVLVSALLYLTSFWVKTAGKELWVFQRIPSLGYSWAASLLLALLAWYELRPIGVANAWIVGG